MIEKRFRRFCCMPFGHFTRSSLVLTAYTEKHRGLVNSSRDCGTNSSLSAKDIRYHRKPTVFQDLRWQSYFQHVFSDIIFLVLCKTIPYYFSNMWKHLFLGSYFHYFRIIVFVRKIGLSQFICSLKVEPCIFARIGYSCQLSLFEYRPKILTPFMSS